MLKDCIITSSTDQNRRPMTLTFMYLAASREASCRASQPKVGENAQLAVALVIFLMLFVLPAWRQDEDALSIAAIHVEGWRPIVQPMHP
ncbi:MAG: hypothetical protein ACLPWF_13120 [Bryobacteraceae bacterium]